MCFTLRDALLIMVRRTPIENTRCFCSVYTVVLPRLTQRKARMIFLGQPRSFDTKMYYALNMYSWRTKVTEGTWKGWKTILLSSYGGGHGTGFAFSPTDMKVRGKFSHVALMLWLSRNVRVSSLWESGSGLGPSCRRCAVCLELERTSWSEGTVGRRVGMDQLEIQRTVH